MPGKIPLCQCNMRILCSAVFQKGNGTSSYQFLASKIYKKKTDPFIRNDRKADPCMRKTDHVFIRDIDLFSVWSAGVKFNL